MVVSLTQISCKVVSIDAELTLLILRSYPLEGDLRKAQTVWDYFTVFRMTGVGIAITQTTVKVLELIGLAPKGTYDVGEALKVAADNLVAGGKEKLFTPMMLFVARA